MNRNFGLAWLVTLFAGTAAASGESLHITISDYAGVETAVLGEAKTIAAGILKQAGVTATWGECIARPETPCSLAAPVDINLRILNASMAKKAGLKGSCLGFAVPAGGLGSVAAVFYHRAVQLSSDGLAPLPAVIGAVMAHEIGHLLSAEIGHSRAGLMRTAWDDWDLKALQQGRLKFTEPQSERMTLNMKRRFGLRQGVGVATPALPGRDAITKAAE